MRIRVLVPAPVPSPISSIFGPRCDCDFGAMSIQNIDLGSRNVILRQLADFLEQRCAALIVEILAWQRARLGGKTRDNV